MSAGAPGFVGYLAAYAVTAVAVTAPFAVAVLLDGATHDPVERVCGALFVMMLGTLAAGIYGLPGGVAGCFLLHLLLLRVSSQGVHVAAFGLAGALTGWAYDAWLFDSELVALPLALGAATAVARLAVVPLVRGRAS